MRLLATLAFLIVTYENIRVGAVDFTSSCLKKVLPSIPIDSRFKTWEEAVAICMSSKVLPAKLWSSDSLIQLGIEWSENNYVWGQNKTYFKLSSVSSVAVGNTDFRALVLCESDFNCGPVEPYESATIALLVLGALSALISLSAVIYITIIACRRPVGSSNYDTEGSFFASLILAYVGLMLRSLSLLLATGTPYLAEFELIDYSLLQLADIAAVFFEYFFGSFLVVAFLSRHLGFGRGWRVVIYVVACLAISSGATVGLLYLSEEFVMHVGAGPLVFMARAHQQYVISWLASGLPSLLVGALAVIITTVAARKAGAPLARNVGEFSITYCALVSFALIYLRSRGAAPASAILYALASLPHIDAITLSFYAFVRVSSHRISHNPLSEDEIEDDESHASETELARKRVPTRLIKMRGSRVARIA